MKYGLFTLLFIALTACNSGSKKGFTINGDIKGIPDQKIFLRLSVSEQMEVQEFESVQITNGQFQFNGNIINPPAIVSLSFEDDEVKLWKRFVIDNSNMSLSIWQEKEDGNSSVVARLDGSESHDQYLKFRSGLEEIDKEVWLFAYEYRKLGNNGELPMEEWSKEDLAKVADMERVSEEANANKEAYLLSAANSENDLKSLFAIPDLYHWGIAPFNSPALCEEAFDQLNTSLKTSHIKAYYSSEILRKSEQARLASEVTVGNVFKDFTQNDQHGKPVTASDGLKSNKYLFLDFWASWCGPCRKENPNLLKAYNKYHDKGFEVLAISIDHDKEAWLKAIEKDGMPWTQVSDLEGPDNVVAKLYAVTGIPSSFLIDRDEGIIVATDLRGKDLDKKLEELLNK